MALGIHNIGAPKGANKNKKRVGRGPGSGTGKTAGRGHKGQKSRSGYSGRPGFEGGQMPLQRRLPKRGFTNTFKKEWLEVKLSDLDNKFEAGEAITPDLMAERGLVKKGVLARAHGVVVLGGGDVTKALTITAHRFSKSAREKIEAAGGTASVVQALVKATDAQAE
ncbi:MAG: 50S ribosomal protein L15 [Acidobacteria bacterium]|nr:50S ribosomal protein L15 [Acidobacteriota bacterium]